MRFITVERLLRLEERIFRRKTRGDSSSGYFYKTQFKKSIQLYSRYCRKICECGGLRRDQRYSPVKLAFASFRGQRKSLHLIDINIIVGWIISREVTHR